MKPELYRPLRLSLLLWGLIFALCATFIYFLGFAIGEYAIPYLGALTEQELFDWVVYVWVFIIIRTFAGPAIKKYKQREDISKLFGG